MSAHSQGCVGRWHLNCTRCQQPMVMMNVLLPQGYTFKGQTHIFPVMPGESGSYFNSSQNPCNSKCARSS